MPEEKTILRPGEIVITLRVSPPLLAGQREQFNMNVEGVENPFVIRRILRHAEDSVVGQVEEQIVMAARQQIVRPN